METWIGGLRLPEALVAAVAAGRWRPPEDEAMLAEVFRDQPDGPRFYDLPGMRHQNKSFQLLGPDAVHGLDATRAVVIGDLGTGMPIVLDYGASADAPRVRYLRVDEWLEIAPDFAALLDLLGL